MQSRNCICVGDVCWKSAIERLQRQGVSKLRLPMSFQQFQAKVQENESIILEEKAALQKQVQEAPHTFVRKFIFGGFLVLKSECRLSDSLPAEAQASAQKSVAEKQLQLDEALVSDCYGVCFECFGTRDLCCCGFWQAVARAQRLEEERHLAEEKWTQLQAKIVDVDQCSY